MSFIVAIDGPAGSGKGTITQIVAEKLNFINIGSGAAYRCVALETINKNINLKDSEKIIKAAKKLNIEYKIEDGKNTIFLNKMDVEKRIREEDVTAIVSEISSIKEIRFILNDIFRKYAENKSVIMEGRDIGTYVFPNADVKIYLDASSEVRAKRRYKQNQEMNIQMEYEEILKNIEKRDENDKNKEIGALKKSEDAIYIDSSDMTIEEVSKKVIKIIKEKISKKGC